MSLFKKESNYVKGAKIADEIFRSYKINEYDRECIARFTERCLDNKVPANVLGIKLCFEFDLTRERRK